VGGPGGDGAAESLLRLVQGVVDEVHRGRGPTATWDARLDADLGLDSLSVVELVARCEDRFGIAATDDLLASVATPRDLLEAMGGDAATHGRAHGDDTSEAAPLTGGGREVARATTLVEVLLGQAEQSPDRVHLRVLGDDDDAGDMTFADLQAEAARVARWRSCCPPAATTSSRSSGCCSPVACRSRSTRPDGPPGWRSTCVATSAARQRAGGGARHRARGRSLARLVARRSPRCATW
jgi:acyl carrier protein